MKLKELIEKLQDLIHHGWDKNQPVYFGDKQQSCDYIVKNADNKLTIKEEWYQMFNSYCSGGVLERYSIDFMEEDIYDAVARFRETMEYEPKTRFIKSMKNEQPDTSTLEGKIAVMQAARTKRIQFSRTSEWNNITVGYCVWNWELNNYRIHPEDLNPAQYRPWTFEEVIIGKTIKSKSNNWFGLILAKYESSVLIAGHSSTYGFKDLLDYFVIESDSSPCGVKIN